jgi:hypothetical protein
MLARGGPPFRGPALACLLVLAQPLAGAIRIVDDQSRPVTGAAVRLTIEPGWQSAVLPAITMDGVSDENGIAPLHVPVAGDPVLAIDHDGFAPTVMDVPPGKPPTEIRLKQGTSWRGHLVVSTPGRKPIDGRVCATGQIVIRENGPRHRWSRCARIENGAFEIKGLPDGAVEVEVQAPGFLPRTTMAEPAQTTDLTLERGVQVTGLVRDMREQPVGGAAVTAGEARVETGRDGRFAIAVPSLPAKLEVSKQGFRGWSAKVARPSPINVQLRPAEQIFGVLLGRAGVPIDAAVVALGQFLDDGRRTTTWRKLEVDRKGNFALDLPEAGRYAIALRVTGYQEMRLPAFVVEEGRPAALGVLSLNQGSGIRGLVVDGSTGKPSAGALIEVIPAGALLLQTVGDRTIPAGISGEDGEFAVEGLDIGRYLVRIRGSGFAAIHRLVDLDKSSAVDLGSVSLEAGVEVNGRIIGRGGPTGQLPIRLFDPAREMLEPLATTTTDDDGRYRFVRVSSGRYRVEVGAERLLIAQEITVPATAPSSELDLQVGGIRVRGRVTRDGVPVRGGTIEFSSELDPAKRRGKIIMKHGRSTLTWGLPQAWAAEDVDAGGMFVVDGAPPGSVRLSYASPEGDVVLRSVVLPARGDTTLSVELDGHLLEGRVVDATTGQTLEGTVRLFHDAGRILTEQRTGTDGLFRFKDLESGRYAIDARAAGYVLPAARPVDVRYETAPLVLGLQPGDSGQIEVRLGRVDGSGVKGLPVSIFDTRGVLVRSLPTVEGGLRQFDELPSAEYIVGWSDPLAGAGCSRRVRVGPFEKPALSEVLEPGTPLVITCPHHRCSGAGIELIEVVSAEGVEMSALLSGISPALHLSKEGEVSVGRVAPGRYLVRLWVAGQRFETTVIVGSEPARIVFQ